MLCMSVFFLSFVYADLKFWQQGYNLYHSQGRPSKVELYNRYSTTQHKLSGMNIAWFCCRHEA